MGCLYMKRTILFSCVLVIMIFSMISCNQDVPSETDESGCYTPIIIQSMTATGFSKSLHVPDDLTNGDKNWLAVYVPILIGWDTDHRVYNGKAFTNQLFASEIVCQVNRLAAGEYVFNGTLYSGDTNDGFFIIRLHGDNTFEYIQDVRILYHSEYSVVHAYSYISNGMIYPHGYSGELYVFGYKKDYNFMTPLTNNHWFDLQYSEIKTGRDFFALRRLTQVSSNIMSSNLSVVPNVEETPVSSNAMVMGIFHDLLTVNSQIPVADYWQFGIFRTNDIWFNLYGTELSNLWYAD